MTFDDLRSSPPQVDLDTLFMNLKRSPNEFLDPAFDLQAYAARDFGSWHDEAEYGEVIWRFSPDAAERAAEWRFHPRQETRRLPDGGLEVRFHAGGWLEMAWHLYCWGDAVEVVAPEALKRLVADYRRPDFGALP